MNHVLLSFSSVKSVDCMEGKLKVSEGTCKGECYIIWEGKFMRKLRKYLLTLQLQLYYIAEQQEKPGRCGKKCFLSSWLVPLQNK